MWPGCQHDRHDDQYDEERLLDSLAENLGDSVACSGSGFKMLRFGHDGLGKSICIISAPLSLKVPGDKSTQLQAIGRIPYLEKISNSH